MVAVMYAGKIIEYANVNELFSIPSHPYTVALLESLPKIERNVGRLYSIKGQPPDLGNLPPGCSFAPRCPHAMGICNKEYPAQREIGDNHTVSCWLIN